MPIQERDVPAKVKEGAVTPITSLDAWRRTWMGAANDPDSFWLRQAKETLRWMKAPTIGCEGSFYHMEQPIRWFSDGQLNVTESCLDRHVETRPDAPAIVWETDEPQDAVTWSYRKLAEEVSRIANALKSLGVKKGDRVVLYMGMVPEAMATMLACARIGAPHSVIFGGFSSDAIRSRVLDSGAKVLVTQDESLRGGRRIRLKDTVDKALLEDVGVEHVLVFVRTGAEINMVPNRDIAWNDLVPKQSTTCPAERMDAEDPLYILYTSGSTGKPKGLVHTCGGYATFIGYTHRTVFDIRPDDVFLCTADVGWVTGHSYTVYAPLINGCATVLFESTPTYPDAGRYWDAVERHKITILYTAPTALRTLAAKDDDYVHRHDLSSLRILGTVGEPINPEAWNWYYDVVGKGECTIVDTWWQTETGGICISPIAPATPVRPGCATLPLPGIQPHVLAADGRILRGPAEGALCIAAPWPGIARTIYGNHERYVSTYFSTHKGFYFAGDGCRRDENGNFWVTGRIDDVINVSGHRIGTAEIESVLLRIDELAESAVVGYPHPIKGQGVCAYMVLGEGIQATEALQDRIQHELRAGIGAHARIDLFEFVDELPKTRSGKIMRRILRKLAEGIVDDLGDTSTLADASVVDTLVQRVNERKSS